MVCCHYILYLVWHNAVINMRQFIDLESIMIYSTLTMALSPRLSEQKSVKPFVVVLCREIRSEYKTFDETPWKYHLSHQSSLTNCHACLRLPYMPWSVYCECREKSASTVADQSINYRTVVYWCAILIAHQLVWQNMEAPVSIFQESPLAGEPRERLFHIHSIHSYQLCAKYLYPSTLLWHMNGRNPWQQPGIIHWCYLILCWKYNDV